MLPMDSDAICFVISAIGPDDSDIRRHANDVFDKLILPVVQKFEYIPLRADHISRPGLITQQIIDYIIDSPLMIADLTGHNPNVFYELAIRHMTKKPIIHIISKEYKIPFDIFDFRTIHYDLREGYIEEAKVELQKQVANLQKNPDSFENPISITMGARQIRLLDSGFVGDLDIVFENTNTPEVILTTIGDFTFPSDRILKRINAVIERKNLPDHSSTNSYPNYSNPIMQSALSMALTMGRFYGEINFDEMSLEELEKRKDNVKKDYLENDQYELFEENSHKINFLIRNNGRSYILDASVKIEFPNNIGILIASEVYIKPTSGPFATAAIRGIYDPKYPEVEYEKDKITVFTKIGKIKHQMNTVAFEEPIRIVIGNQLSNSNVPIKITLYGENLPDPIIRELTIHVPGKA
jgi:hypothetical protein